MQYRYHEALSDKVYEITSGCEVPDGYEDHFESASCASLIARWALPVWLGI